MGYCDVHSQSWSKFNEISPASQAGLPWILKKEPVETALSC